MLAATIGKPAPPDDDDLVTVKKKSGSKKSADYSSQYTDSQSQGSFSQSQSSQSSSSSSFVNRENAASFGGFVSASSIPHVSSAKRSKSKYHQDKSPKKKRFPERVKSESSIKPKPLDSQRCL
ncbi:hypothetical protein G6F42_023118 [Rhizopus arrhizus]|nr:hypothetical protein G6F42_023118 [Rhizopus arrhizus]